MKCNCKKKSREEKEYKDLINRLNRIEGQVRGVKKMVDEDRYCVDILTQTCAIEAAIRSFNKSLMSEHIRTCVVHDIKNDENEAVDELVKVVQRLMK